MKRNAIILFAFAFSAPANAAASIAHAFQEELNTIIAQSRPAVVNIRTTQEKRYRVASPYELYGYMFGAMPGNSQVYRQVIQGNGSGVVIERRTNAYHDGMYAIVMRGHPFFLFRTAQSNENDAGARIVDGRND